MYTATSLIGVERGTNKRWVNIGLLDYKVNELFQKFRKLWVTVVVLPDTTEHYLDMDNVSAMYADYTGRINDMFIDNADNALPTVDVKPIIETKTAIYRDGIRSNYKATPVSPLYGTNTSDDNRTSLMLTRTSPVTDYVSFQKHAMVTVNGFFHMIDTDGESGILVYDGNKSRMISNNNQFGIYSFKNVCQLEYVPITQSMLNKRLSPEMIAGTVPAEDFSKIGFVKVDKDLTNKTVMFVIGGYLYGPDSNVISKVSDTEFEIDFQRIPLLNRYFESKEYIDLTGLGLSTTVKNPSQIAVSELLSDAVLYKYLTLSQSFIVIFDTPEMFANKAFIRKTGMPGMYVAYNEPNDLLVTGAGRTPEYWVTYEDGQYSVKVANAVARQRIYNTNVPLSLNSVAKTQAPVDPDVLSPAYFLEIGRDLKAA